MKFVRQVDRDGVISFYPAPEGLVAADVVDVPVESFASSPVQEVAAPGTPGLVWCLAILILIGFILYGGSIR